MLQLFGAFVSLCLGAGLLVWAVAVDVMHFGGDRSGRHLQFV
jgi:hypothetical protein